MRLYKKLHLTWLAAVDWPIIHLTCTERTFREATYKYVAYKQMKYTIENVTKRKMYFYSHDYCDYLLIILLHFSSQVDLLRLLKHYQLRVYTKTRRHSIPYWRDQHDLHDFMSCMRCMSCRTWRTWFRNFAYAFLGAGGHA